LTVIPFDSIQASVGKYNNGATNCYNVPKDVAVVVKLLNLIAQADGGTNENKLTATPSPDQLFRAILRFQQTQNNLGKTPRLSVDGHVDPGGLTLSRLNQVARRIGPIDPPDFPPDPPIPIPNPPILFRRSAWRIINTGNIDFSVLFAALSGGVITLQKMPEPNIFNLLFAAVGPGFSLDASKLFPGLDKASKVLKAKGFANKLSGKVAKFFRDLIVAFLTGEPALLESLLPSSLPGFSGAIFLTRGPTEPTLQQFAQGLLTIISLNAGIGVAVA